MSLQRWTNGVRSARKQIYVSKLRDPFANLSIEHYLLNKTPPDSIILFIYVNRPCVVIGRNQNPWTEVNLPSLHQSSTREQDNPSYIDLVRRRSGGGTVFHDEGNLNYSVICAPSAFSRDKHAIMVAKALRTFDPTAHVNDRHDIVLTREGNGQSPGSNRKVSGSAYKLTRLRSLHHGTCLVASPNIKTISTHLNAPARAYIKARGVESVRSPIANLIHATKSPLRAVKDVQHQILRQFGELYSVGAGIEALPQSQASEEAYTSIEVSQNRDEWISASLGADLLNIEDVRKGMQELKSRDWIYGQTPGFTLSSHPTEQDPRQRPKPHGFHQDVDVILSCRSGRMDDVQLVMKNQDDSLQAKAESRKLEDLLRQTTIADVGSFEKRLRESGLDPAKNRAVVFRWLDIMFGKEARVTPR